YFNLEKLGAAVHEYKANFYGTDYATSPEGRKIGLASDRLFAEWHLESEKVEALAAGEKFVTTRKPDATIEIMNDWSRLVESDPAAALTEQMRIRDAFEAAFAHGFVGREFRRDDERPAYLLYAD